MTNRTRVCVLATLTLFGTALSGTALPAFAQQQVPADANKALWCATAFGLVEPQARTQGDAAAADNFHKYAEALTGTGNASLKQAGFTDDQIKTTTTGYTDKVTKELSGDAAAEFSVVECTMLVDPAAAAAMQQPADNAAPADGATAPDTTTPAPASK